MLWFVIEAVIWLSLIMVLQLWVIHSSFCCNDIDFRLGHQNRHLVDLFSRYSSLEGWLYKLMLSGTNDMFLSPGCTVYNTQNAMTVSLPGNKRVGNFTGPCITQSITKKRKSPEVSVGAPSVSRKGSCTNVYSLYTYIDVMMIPLSIHYP